MAQVMDTIQTTNQMMEITKPFNEVKAEPYQKYFQQKLLHGQKYAMCTQR